MTSDPASTYTRLRAETAALLGVDPDDLSKTEGLRLDITSLLLLEIDSLQGSILANEKVDLARLSTALAMLQKMLPQSLVAPVPDARKDDTAVLEVEAMIDGLLAARAQADAKRDADTMWREEMAAVAAAGGNVDLAAVSPAAADGDASDSGVLGSSPSRAPAAPLTAEQKMERANNQPPPAHYLRGADESWRRHIDASGEIIGPYWRGGYG
jgi:hypothetical protein